VRTSDRRRGRLFTVPTPNRLFSAERARETHTLKDKIESESLKLRKLQYETLDTTIKLASLYRDLELVQERCGRCGNCKACI
jgi:hypothetical protein